MAANLIYKGDDCLYGYCPKYLARHMLVLGWQMRIEMKILLNWSPLRQLFTYIQERFTFLVLLCWPAIIWLFCRVGVWLTDNVYELLGKSPAQSFTVYLQPFMTPGTLLRISISWVVLLFILFSMAMAFTWGLRRFMNRHK
ncbi:Uncharacterised protein [Klebsiella pneumoniae]|nr:hypothetical protein SL56_03925 [Klebsiella pneumoniae]STV33587.1 Uncharacterised protein [Klebsiella pneumoniae]